MSSLKTALQAAVLGRPTPANYKPSLPITDAGWRRRSRQIVGALHWARPGTLCGDRGVLSDSDRRYQRIGLFDKCDRLAIVGRVYAKGSTSAAHWLGWYVFLEDTRLFGPFPRRVLTKRFAERVITTERRRARIDSKRT